MIVLDGIQLLRLLLFLIDVGGNAARLPVNACAAMTCSVAADGNRRSKLVWVWTESRQVMTAAVERGWNTFLFRSEPRSNDLANEWSCELLMPGFPYPPNQS